MRSHGLEIVVTRGYSHHTCTGKIHEKHRWMHPGAEYSKQLAVDAHHSLKTTTAERPLWGISPLIYIRYLVWITRFLFSERVKTCKKYLITWYTERRRNIGA